MRLLLKILMVIGLTIAILVPLLMIRGTIQDRQMYRREAVQTVARSSAGSSTRQLLIPKAAATAAWSVRLKSTEKYRPE